MDSKNGNEPKVPKGTSQVYAPPVDFDEEDMWKIGVGILYTMPKSGSMLEDALFMSDNIIDVLTWLQNAREICQLLKQFEANECIPVSVDDSMITMVQVTDDLKTLLETIDHNDNPHLLGLVQTSKELFNQQRSEILASVNADEINLAGNSGNENE